MSFKNDQVSREETERIIALAREMLPCEGDFVELGCYRGDTSLALAEIIQNNADHKLWIYDSFEGLPDKSDYDESVIGVDFKKGELLVTKREVKERFLRAGFKLPVIKKAWFSELKDEDLPEKIALAFLDGDFYDSIRDSLRLVESKMVRGGLIVVHDYDNEALPGVRKAVDEWLGGHSFNLERFKSLAIINC